MLEISSYSAGRWIGPEKEGAPLFNASNGEVIGLTSRSHPDFEEMIEYAKSKGGNTLRSLTFHERGRMLKALALYLNKHKEEFYKISYLTGATKTDSWIDIEGGFGNLFTYASKGRREMPNLPFYVDGSPEKLSKEGTFMGHHIYTPLEGVAVHINAFNFPVWGMLEKIAVNLLAGMPAIVKPATSTSFLTEAVFKKIIDSNILPEGSLQLICGSARGLVDYLSSQDVVTFTGSASTGILLKSNENIIKNSIRFNMEADSLNCSIFRRRCFPRNKRFRNLCERA